MDGEKIILAIVAIWMAVNGIIWGILRFNVAVKPYHPMETYLGIGGFLVGAVLLYIYLTKWLQ